MMACSKRWDDPVPRAATDSVKNAIFTPQWSWIVEARDLTIGVHEVELAKGYRAGLCGSFSIVRQPLPTSLFSPD